jgi:hypothetical protein
MNSSFGCIERAFALGCTHQRLGPAASAAASERAASALSQTSSDAGAQFSGRVPRTWCRPVVHSQVGYRRCAQQFDELGRSPPTTWSSRQKMWASSCVKPRTRIMPCMANQRARSGGRPRTRPCAAAARGTTLLADWSKIWMWPGQFIGLTAQYPRPRPLSHMNMAWPNFSAWPDFSHRLLSRICGVFTSL